ncbi:MAG: hypothetical protein WCK98_03745 [bacterium]
MARRKKFGEAFIKDELHESAGEQLASKIGKKLEAQRTLPPIDKVEGDTNSDKLENEEDLDSNQ